MPGWTRNRPGLVLATISKLTVCAASLAGPGLRAVAQLGYDGSATRPIGSTRSGPLAKLGASLTELIVTGMMASADRPEASVARTVSVALPKASGGTVNVSVPAALLTTSVWNR